MYKVQGYAMGQWCLWKEMADLQAAKDETRYQCVYRYMDFRVVDMDTSRIEFMVYFDYSTLPYSCSTKPILPEPPLDWRRYGF